MTALAEARPTTGPRRALATGISVNAIMPLLIVVVWGMYVLPIDKSAVVCWREGVEFERHDGTYTGLHYGLRLIHPAD